MGSKLLDVRWGVPPPPKAGRQAISKATPKQLAAMAYARPGEWGSYEYDDAQRASVSAFRINEHSGVEACARGAWVFFRYEG